MMKLHNYFRSSASYRVRIALYLKGIPFEYIPVHLIEDGGAQHTTVFRQRNPQSLVPVLEDGAVVLSQSLVILEYLEERYPNPSLLPKDSALRAHARQIALSIACEMQPLCNLRVLQYLSTPLALPDAAKEGWSQHWLTLGLQALEAWMVRADWRGKFCVGNEPGLADCCLIPQLFTARRFNIDLTAFPTLLEIEQHCQALEAFQLAHPSCQPDTPTQSRHN